MKPAIADSIGCPQEHKDKCLHEGGTYNDHECKCTPKPACPEHVKRECEARQSPRFEFNQHECKCVDKGGPCSYFPSDMTVQAELTAQDARGSTRRNAYTRAVPTTITNASARPSLPVPSTSSKSVRRERAPASSLTNTSASVSTKVASLLTRSLEA